MRINFGEEELNNYGKALEKGDFEALCDEQYSKHEEVFFFIALKRIGKKNEKFKLGKYTKEFKKEKGNGAYLLMAQGLRSLSHGRFNFDTLSQADDKITAAWKIVSRERSFVNSLKGKVWKSCYDYLGLIFYLRERFGSHVMTTWV